MPKSGKRGVVAGRPSSISQLFKRSKWNKAAQTSQYKKQNVPVTVPVPALMGPSKVSFKDVTSAPGHTSQWSKDGQLSKSENTVFHDGFSIRTSSDRSGCFLSRMITLPDGRIVVLDKYNGPKIKLFSESYCLYDEVECKYCTAVTCVDSNTISVVTESDDIVTYSLIGDKIRETDRKKHRNGDLYDIAYGQGKYILRYQSTDGLECLQYGTNIISKENNRLSRDEHMYYDSKNEFLLVGYFIEDVIKCLSLDGELKWKVEIESGPQGIIVVDDRILVAVWRDNTIREITLDGKLLPKPLMPSADSLNTLAYQRKQGKLLVGSKWSETVKVFNLTQ